MKSMKKSNPEKLFFRREKAIFSMFVFLLLAVSSLAESHDTFNADNPDSWIADGKLREQVYSDASVLSNPNFNRWDLVEMSKIEKNPEIMREIGWSSVPTDKIREVKEVNNFPKDSMQYVALRLELEQAQKLEKENLINEYIQNLVPIERNAAFLKQSQMDKVTAETWKKLENMPKTENNPKGYETIEEIKAEQLSPQTIERM